MMPKELDIDIYDFAAYIAKLCAVRKIKLFFLKYKSYVVKMYCKYKVYCE